MRIRDVSVTFWYRIRFAISTQVDESAIKNAPEILNPEFEVQTLHPNTFKSRNFWSVNDSLKNPDIFPPTFLYFFGNCFNLLTILSRLKTLTSNISLWIPAYITFPHIPIRDHFRCLFGRRRTVPAGSYDRSIRDYFLGFQSS